MTNVDTVTRLALLDIQCVVFDVDGVLTDGSIVVDSQGQELFKTFNVKDGVGIQMLVKAGLHTAIITGRKSGIVEHRATALGIECVYQGQLQKTAAFEDLLSKLQLSEKQIAYIGDDQPDVPLLHRVGFAACPADAHESAKKASVWHSQYCGGKGAVREFADLLLEAVENKNAR